MVHRVHNDTETDFLVCIKFNMVNTKIIKQFFRSIFLFVLPSSDEYEYIFSDGKYILRLGIKSRKKWRKKITYRMFLNSLYACISKHQRAKTNKRKIFLYRTVFEFIYPFETIRKTNNLVFLCSDSNPLLLKHTSHLKYRIKEILKRKRHRKRKKRKHHGYVNFKLNKNYGVFKMNGKRKKIIFSINRIRIWALLYDM